MQQLNAANIALVRTALKGAKLAKFDASIAVLEASIAQQAWTKRGSVKASSGFYQGLTKARTPDGTEVCSTDWYCLCGVTSTINYGSALRFMKADRNPDFEALTDGERVARAVRLLRADGQLKKVSDEVILAWVALSQEVKAISALLDDARPAPVVTAIGLSPKVTATLTEMNLDLDLPSIKLAKIETRYRDEERYNKVTGEWEYVLNKDGSRKQESYYVVVWTDGIVHNRSRFASGNHCHACGKNIPSGRYVPVEAQDKKSGQLVSMWIGCDCAKNIFGIKDVGVEKSA